MPTTGLIISNISQLVTCKQGFTGCKEDEDSLGFLENACVVIEGEKIVWVGKQSDFKAENYHFSETIDASGCTVLPGFIDSHTHAVFAGSRDDEYEMRISGMPYMEIASKGGGITSTVMAVRKASEENLFTLALDRVNSMVKHGTTTLEIKSGYGLTLEDELKMLRVIKRLDESADIDIVPTFLGAHEFPPEYRERRDSYVDLVIKDMIPAVSEENLAEFCDVFCEEGVFTAEQTRKILMAAKDAGMKLTLHADEFAHSWGAEIAAELGALSASHLGHASREGLEAMKNAGTIAILLPGTGFGLGKVEFANARELMDMGLEVALATDFNPGSSMLHSLPIVTSIACSFMKMTPAEAVRAITLTAAKALAREDEVGSIEPGKQADIVIISSPSYRYVPYFVGGDIVERVIKKGKVIHTA